MEQYMIVIPGKPTAKGRPRFTRNGNTYTPKTTRNAEKTMRGYFKEVLGEKIITSPVMLSIAVCFRNKALKTRMKKAARYHTPKPDIDNLLKLIMDAMSDHLISDSQISSVVITKLVSRQDPRTVIYIHEFDPDTEFAIQG